MSAKTNRLEEMFATHLGSHLAVSHSVYCGDCFDNNAARIIGSACVYYAKQVKVVSAI